MLLLDISLQSIANTSSSILLHYNSQCFLRSKLQRSFPNNVCRFVLQANPGQNVVTALTAILHEFLFACCTLNCYNKPSNRLGVEVVLFCRVFDSVTLSILNCSISILISSVELSLFTEFPRCQFLLSLPVLVVVLQFLRHIRQATKV